MMHAAGIVNSLAHRHFAPDPTRAVNEDNVALPCVAAAPSNALASDHLLAERCFAAAKRAAITQTEADLRDACREIKTYYGELVCWRPGRKLPRLDNPCVDFERGSSQIRMEWVGIGGVASGSEILPSNSGPGLRGPCDGVTDGRGRACTKIRWEIDQARIAGAHGVRMSDPETGKAAARVVGPENCPPKLWVAPFSVCRQGYDQTLATLVCRTFRRRHAACFDVCQPRPHDAGEIDVVDPSRGALPQAPVRAAVGLLQTTLEMSAVPTAQRHEARKPDIVLDAGIAPGLVSGIPLNAIDTCRHENDSDPPGDRRTLHQDRRRRIAFAIAACSMAQGRRGAMMPANGDDAARGRSGMSWPRRLRAIPARGQRAEYRPTLEISAISGKFPFMVEDRQGMSTHA